MPAVVAGRRPASDGLSLVLDGATGGCLAGVVRGGAVVAEIIEEGGRSAVRLPEMARAALGGARPDRVVVTVGPGSFTGVRAGLAVAHGIGVALGVPVVGVTVGAAIRAAFGAAAVWVVVDNRRGQVFLDDGERVRVVGLEGLPEAPAGLVVGGDAAEVVLARLRERGKAAEAGPGRPGALGMALAAGREAVEAVPLYVEGPEARPVRLRPAPA